MRKLKRICFIVSALFGFQSIALAAPKEIKVLTDRTDFHLKPLFKKFEEITGVRVDAAFVDKGLLPRLETRPSEPDLVITKDAELMVLANEKKLLTPFKSASIDKRIPVEFRSKDHAWLGLSYRARVIYYSRDRVKPEELSTYENLADPKWKGRVCIRPGTDDYNLNLFSQMLEDLGEQKLKTFLQGLKANLAVRPQGNDREQAKNIFEKKCDVAVANTYYMGIMLSEPKQRDWAAATRIFFPNQQAGGTYILMSAAGLTKANRDIKSATKLLEFLTEELAQDHMSQVTFEYALKPFGDLPPIVQSFGAEQPGIENGVFKKKLIPLEKIAKNRDIVVRLLNEVKFDE